MSPKGAEAQGWGPGKLVARKCVRALTVPSQVTKSQGLPPSGRPPPPQQDCVLAAGGRTCVVTWPSSIKELDTIDLSTRPPRTSLGHTEHRQNRACSWGQKPPWWRSPPSSGCWARVLGLQFEERSCEKAGNQSEFDMGQ